MKYLMYLLIVCVFASCVSSTREVSGCYSLANGKDTVSLSVNILNDDVKGSLKYNLLEKDQNVGLIYGHMHGDTLIAEYSFTAEGMTSSREVAFLMKDNVMTEGYGEMEERDGKYVFTNRHTLDFTSGIILSETDCKP